MRLHTPFVRLPLAIDASALAAEVAALPDDTWRAHPEAFPGNTAVPLVAVGGDPGDDGVLGPMRPTPVLTSLPYTTRILGALGSVIGRTRLMRIAEESEVSPHVDVNHYWWDHLRVHVPVVTTPDVTFHCGDEQVHMAAGEAWVFDTWREHRVDNPAGSPRTHLVIDTVGSPDLWRLVEDPSGAPTVVDPAASDPVLVVTEAVNHHRVMPPVEVEATIGAVCADLHAVDPAAAHRVEAGLRPFTRAWRMAWALHGDAPSGAATYRSLVAEAERILDPLTNEARLQNNVRAENAIRHLVLFHALAPGLANGAAAPSAAAPVAPARAAPRPGPVAIERPVIVVSPPRSGSSLLFETIARSSGLCTIGGESHAVIEGIPALTPAAHDWASNRLDAIDATPETVATLRSAFASRLRDAVGAPPTGTARLLEKTPKNALRVPFLASVFPDATFVYLYRDPRETVSSMLDAWRSGRFVTYPDLPGWEGPPWSLVLVPGWRELIGRELAAIVTEQWATTTSMLLDDLEALPPDRWCVASYERLVADPDDELARIGEFCGFEVRAVDGPLPPSRHTLDAPDPSKWQRNAAEIEPELARVREVGVRAHAVFGRPPMIRPAAGRDAAATPVQAVGEAGTDAPLKSVHSATFPALLDQLGSSLLVSTYQSGHLVSLRAVDGKLNTHFRRFRSPMGIARQGASLAVGTKHEVVMFHDQPAVARSIEPVGTHDACFVPRRTHVTGDIRVHDLAFAEDDELWVVNTRFSCLATLDDDHSFVPRWRPAFVSALAPEDRCHLNGLAMVDGAPRYVTALGRTDTAGGWREHKAFGGLLLDVASDAEVAGGLCMPHSPRWHDGRLWVLQSGNGTLGVVDVEAGTVEEIAKVPGFARGLDFAGPYAFVGLSQVREHVFDGLPLTAEGVERTSGVWVVDTRDGRTVALLRFEGSVREVYEVCVLPGVRMPEIAEVGADLVDGAFVLPDAALAEVPAEHRKAPVPGA